MRTTSALSCLALLISLAACGGGSDGGGGGGVTTPPVTPVVTTVAVALTSSTIEIGATTTATATVFDQNNAPITGKTITWSSDNTAVATVSSGGVVTGLAKGTANITASVEGKQGQAQSTVVTSSKWVVDNVILSNADFANVAGSLANTTVLRLNDGRYRLFVSATPENKGMVSAISTDGVHFTLESGIRVPSTATLSDGTTANLGHPEIVRLPDGRARIYMRQHPGFASNSAASGIYSLTSTDEGLTFTADPGVRLTAAAAGWADMSGVRIVKMKSGIWRMYFSSNNPNTTQGSTTILASDSVKSATSSDLVTWVMDAGVRIGIALPIAAAAVHPGAMVNDDGSVTLTYVSNSAGGSRYAVSADGLTFTTQSAADYGSANGAPVNSGDSFLYRLDNGDVRLYFNWGDNLVGKIYTAHRSAFAVGKP